MEVSRPGVLLRILKAMRDLGWGTYHSYEEIASASGIPLRTVKRWVSLLEQHNYLYIRYDPDNPRRKLFRPKKSVIRFTDGFVTYVFSLGLFNDIDVEVILE